MVVCRGKEVFRKVNPPTLSSLRRCYFIHLPFGKFVISIGRRNIDRIHVTIDDCSAGSLVLLLLLVTTTTTTATTGQHSDHESDTGRFVGDAVEKSILASSSSLLQVVVLIKATLGFLGGVSSSFHAGASPLGETVLRVYFGHTWILKSI